MVRMARGRQLTDGQVMAVTNLVAGSVPGLNIDAVKVVDQHGKLLTQARDPNSGRLDLQAQAAAGNAARAEGLLISFATRRSIERGAELGYLADQLRLRFGDALPNAVRTLTDMSRNPVTLDQLLARLEGLEPKLRSSPQEPSLHRLRRELSNLFVIRRQSAPSPEAADRTGENVPGDWSLRGRDRGSAAHAWGRGSRPVGRGRAPLRCRAARARPDRNRRRTRTAQAA